MTTEIKISCSARFATKNELKIQTSMIAPKIVCSDIKSDKQFWNNH